jgi:uncharacterized protein
MLKVMMVVLLAAIRMYRILISPIIGTACRFIPTCSEYSEAAIIKYGPIKGLKMAILRLLRCHPFHNGGFDPLP